MTWLSIAWRAWANRLRGPRDHAALQFGLHALLFVEILRGYEASTDQRRIPAHRPNRRDF